MTASTPRGESPPARARAPRPSASGAVARHALLCPRRRETPRPPRRTPPPSHRAQRRRPGPRRRSRPARGHPPVPHRVAPPTRRQADVKTRVHPISLQPGGLGRRRGGLRGRGRRRGGLRGRGLLRGEWGGGERRLHDRRGVLRALGGFVVFAAKHTDANQGEPRADDRRDRGVDQPGGEATDSFSSPPPSPAGATAVAPRGRGLSSSDPVRSGEGAGSSGLAAHRVLEAGAAAVAANPQPVVGGPGATMPKPRSHPRCWLMNPATLRGPLARNRSPTDIVG